MTREPVLSNAQLNRTLLARQALLARVRSKPATMIERVVGMQAQTPHSPYAALWSRIRGFDPESASKLLATRKTVRTVLMRSTLHLVTARDCLGIRPLVAEALERNLWTGSEWGRRVKGVDIEALVAEGRALLDEKPRTASDLADALAERFPKADHPALPQALRNLVPLVQVPPRGLWQESGAPVLAVATSWLGKPLAKRPSLEVLVERYLKAFGPASVADVQAWSGLTRLRDVVEAMPLARYRAEDGTLLFDARGGKIAKGDEHAPARFLPDFDNLWLAHADRSRILGPGEGAQLDPTPRLLVDGFVRGRWVVRPKTAARATLRVQAKGKLTKAERADVVAEGKELLAFLAPASRTRKVEIVRRL